MNLRLRKELCCDHKKTVKIEKKKKRKKNLKLRSQQNCGQQYFEHKKTFVEINFFKFEINFFYEITRKLNRDLEKTTSNVKN